MPVCYRRGVRHLVLGLAACVCWLTSAGAQAYEEQLSLDLAGGYGHLAPDLGHAPGGELGMSWGLNDAFTVRG